MFNFIFALLLFVIPLGINVPETCDIDVDTTIQLNGQTLFLDFNPPAPSSLLWVISFSVQGCSGADDIEYEWEVWLEIPGHGDHPLDSGTAYANPYGLPSVFVEEGLESFNALKRELGIQLFPTGTTLHSKISASCTVHPNGGDTAEDSYKLI